MTLRQNSLATTLLLGMVLVLSSVDKAQESSGDIPLVSQSGSRATEIALTRLGFLIPLNE